MKRISVSVLAILLLFFCGCTKNAQTANPEQKAEKEIIAVNYPLDKYDLDAYTQPYWSGNIVYQESLMLVENKDGSVPDAPLLYPATQIISVRSSDLQTEYQAGVDYELADGKLRILPDSAIPTVAYEEYYPSSKTDKSMELNAAYGSGYIFFSEGSVVHSMQIAVTYAHEGTFPGEIPACKRTQLPKTIAKLENGEYLRIAVYGDSISTGRNSSQQTGAMPNARPWYQMFVDKLAVVYPEASIALHNPSVSGKKSDWGAEEAKNNVGYGPDLCIIAFGMNDGTKLHSTEYYRRNIRTIMDAARAGNPDCEFVLVATMLANPEASNFAGCQKDYLPVLLEMEEEGVVVMDMTTLHENLLTRKRYYDMTGNNVNHPNDFLARAYAQNLWQTVIGY